MPIRDGRILPERPYAPGLVWSEHVQGFVEPGSLDPEKDVSSTYQRGRFWSDKYQGFVYDSKDPRSVRSKDTK